MTIDINSYYIVPFVVGLVFVTLIQHSLTRIATSGSACKTIHVYRLALFFLVVLADPRLVLLPDHIDSFYNTNA